MKVAKQWAILALVLSVVFGMFGGTAFGASTRYAVVEEVVGVVKVTKAGGSKEVRVFAGMGLNEGDKLKVGERSSVTLRIADREDEIVLGENWSGTLSKLKEHDNGGTDTAVKTWAGSMYNNVRKMTGSNDTYKVETPTAVMGVRGTHFILTIDPRTGLPKIIVNAGRVDASDKLENGGTVPVLPSQEITLYPGEDPSIGIDYIDPEDLVISVDTSVIEKLLRNKAEIDEENEELLDYLRGTDGEGSTLSLTDEEILERYRTNVENSLIHILKFAAEAGKLDETTLNDIIEAANQAIEDITKKYDLDRDIPPIDRMAGVDPEVEEQRRRQREEAEQRKREKREQQEEMLQELQDSKQELINRLQERMKEQQEANEKAEEEKKREAEENRKNQLTDEERQLLEERLRQRKEEQEKQDRRESPTPSPTPTPAPPPSSGARASQTVVDVSKSEIVYGESFVITAEVTSSGTAVPDGGSVAFRSGTQTIGTATTSGGKATLIVDEAASREFFNSGTREISAAYAGNASYQSSTSLAKSLTVKPAETVVTLNASVSAGFAGDLVSFNASVAAKAPGSGQPAGTIALYRGDELVGEPIEISGGTHASFQTVLEGAPGTSVSYKAVFASADGNYAGNTSAERSIQVIENSEDAPTAVLEQRITDGGFEIVVTLQNFTGDNALYGVQLNFRHSDALQIGPGANTEYIYNHEKFTPSESVETISSFRDYYVGGQPAAETVYAFMLFGRETGVEFTEEEVMATFGLTSQSGAIDPELVFWQFVDRNGNLIPVTVELIGFNE